MVEYPIEVAAPHIWQSSDRQPIWSSDRSVRENLSLGSGLLPDGGNLAYMLGSAGYFGTVEGLGGRRFRRGGTPNNPSPLLIPNNQPVNVPSPPLGQPSYFSGGYVGGYVPSVPESLQGSGIPNLQGNDVATLFPSPEHYGGAPGDPSSFGGPLPGIYSTTKRWINVRAGS